MVEFEVEQWPVKRQIWSMTLCWKSNINVHLLGL